MQTDLRSSPVRERLAFIDAAKAVGISLVVLGHSPGLPPMAVVMIYSFHMPLFFFISGFVQSATRGNAGPGDFLRKNARTLLVPYLSFFVISLAYWLATRHLGDRARKFAGVSVGDALKGFATGLSDDLFVNPALWFLPCLFFCSGLYFLLRRRIPALGVVIGATVCVAAWTYATGWRTRLPLSFDIAWVALVFYAAGDALRDSRCSVLSWPTRGTLIALPFVIVAWIFAALHLGRVDLANVHFNNIWLYLCTAFLGIAVMLLISRFVPANAVSRWLADQSLIIFGLHVLFINLASGGMKFLHLEGGFDESGLLPLLLFVWVMLASLPTSKLLTRHFPLMLGRQPSKGTL